MKRLSLALLSCLIITGCSSQADPQPAASEQPPSAAADRKPAVSQPSLTSQTVELPYSMYSKPNWVNGKLVLGVNDQSEFINKIISYDPSSQTTEVLFESEHEQPTIHTIIANERWFVWVDATASVDSYKMYAQNWQTGERLVLTESQPDQSSLTIPVIDGDFVAWTAVNSQGVPQVLLYDLKQKKRQVVGDLTSYSILNTFVSITDGQLLWSDSQDGKGLLNVYDTGTGRKQTYHTPVAHPGYAKRAGEMILSMNFVTPEYWHKQEFGMLNPQDGSYAKLRSGPINRFETFGDLVALLTDYQHLQLYRLQDGKLVQIEVETPLTQPDTIDISSGHLLIAKSDTTKKTTLISIVNLSASSNR